ncbi:uncharacterized protein L969DRAFT_72416 [Mixia osmundae IAM 14324]|uniref:3-methyl-2-oxobutanoate hydroxymethyltransferase n=1 Tax=Mixia osmundae (strain CBS 9802 / IAM 14324 / JCM 22182 / KY 12970) TaxID=764103 RepID=G7EAQ5_MIXOS|nr:uncharacterized protein L969DRAFT_72416 [Mixia osmundae IAM 14324]KEI40884.1 hypothetical protein L969DRAFT_72416 [Mixia osmundae IAM 14324]GAA99915.1 hypothetical protein E5Q_06618 [Mixia osmundae IAM 14324]
MSTSRQAAQRLLRQAISAEAKTRTSVGVLHANACRPNLPGSEPVASSSHSQTRRYSLLAKPAGSDSTHRAACTCAEQKRFSSRPAEAPPSHSAPTKRKVTLLDIAKAKEREEPITVITAHDYASASWAERSQAVDITLVGDSLAMVACGYQSTTEITLDEFLYHCRAVARGTKSSLLVADMPFGTYHESDDIAVKNAVRIIQEGHMDAVKIEGGAEVADLVRRLTNYGIPVMCHIGLTPQRQSALGGYRVQGKTSQSAMKIYTDAKRLEWAGAFAVVLEAIPSQLASYVTQKLDAMATIGIGAGSGCSGQVLVQLDMLGGFDRFVPRFAKQYLNVAELASSAIKTYSQEIKTRKFPIEGTHTYPMKLSEWEEFLDHAISFDEELEAMDEKIKEQASKMV